MVAKKCVLVFAVVVLMWPALADGDEGRPVTAADLSGKTVCWNGGLVTSYYADGREINNHGRRSLWSVPEPGLVRFGPVPGTPEWTNFTHYNYAPMIVLRDGRFQTHRFFGKSGGSLTSADIYTDHYGTACNRP